MRRTLWLFALATLVSAPLAPDPAAAEWRRRSEIVATHVRLIRLVDRDLPARAYVLRVVLDDDVSVVPALAGGRFPSVASTLRIARGEGAIAAVNGDLGLGRPMHPFAIAGRLATSGYQAGNVVALSSDAARASAGRPHVRIVADPAGGDRIRLESWNARLPGPDGVAVFSREGGLVDAPPPRSCAVRLVPAGETATTPGDGWSSSRYVVEEVRCAQGAMAVERDVVLAARRAGTGAAWIRGLQIGTEVAIRWSTSLGASTNVQGGQPILVRNGRVVAPRSCATFMCLRQPRTGVGVGPGCLDDDLASRCVVLLVVVDGRRLGWSAGLTLVAFGRLLRRVGAVHAVNMDGGGSSQLVIRGRIVNRPATRPLREVPAAWLVIRTLSTERGYP